MEDESLAATVADALGRAIENSQMMEEALNPPVSPNGQAQPWPALAGAARPFRSEPAPDELLQTLAEAAQHLVGAGYAAVGLYDEDGLTETIVPLGIGEDEIRAIRSSLESQELFRIASESHEPIRLNDVGPDHQSALPSHGPRRGQWLDVPIVSRGRVWGSIFVGNQESDRPFTEEQEQLLVNLAPCAAVAIENAQLYRHALQNLRHQEHLIAELRRVQCGAARLISNLDLDAVLHEILRMIAAVSETEMSSICMLDKDRHQLVAGTATGLPEEYVRIIAHLPFGALHRGKINQVPDPVVIVEELRQDPAWQPYLDLSERLGIRAVWSVPIIGKDCQLLGIFSAYYRDRFRPRQEQVELVQAYAQHLAVAMENAALYEQVRQAEMLYRDVYENAPDGYHAVGTDAMIREMNATLSGWLGYGREEVIGKMRYDDLLTPEGQRKFQQLLVQCKREGHTDHVELDFVRKDGRLLPMRLTMMVIRDAMGRYQGCRVTARDITKERELEAQLLGAQKLESLGTLVGGIAHDFNNILTGILGFTQLLLRQGHAGDGLHEGLQRIELLSMRASDMIRQLLAFSRQGVSQRRCLALHPFLKETSKLLERMIPENIEIALSLDTDDPVVEADPTQLQQVLMNLVVNARDAMPQGGRIEIETTLVELDESFCQAHPDTPPGRYVRLSIGDTGMGIAPEIRSRIFDPFFTTKEVGKGTGLGLPVVYSIVKNHGGAIEVSSQMGEGTTVQVFWPLAESVTTEVATHPGETCQGSELILLVEDDPIVLELGRKALEYFGYQVLIASDGVEALAIYRKHQAEISLVILDVVLPRMGGRETFRELRRIDPSVKVLLTTGYGLDETVEVMLEEGVCGLVGKPYRIHDLAQAVHAILEPQGIGRYTGA